MIARGLFHKVKFFISKEKDKLFARLMSLDHQYDKFEQSPRCSPLAFLTNHRLTIYHLTFT